MVIMIDADAANAKILRYFVRSPSASSAMNTFICATRSLSCRVCFPVEKMFKHPGVIGFYCLILLPLFNAQIQVRVIVNGSFRLQIFPRTLDNPTNCTLTNPQNVEIHIPLNYDGGDSQTDDSKIVPLGNNLCGVRIFNATSSTDVGRWILTLLNEDEFITETYRVSTTSWEEPVNRSSSAVIGSMGTTILCGPSNMVYCELRDPLGNPVTLTSRIRCETVIQGVKATDFGVWTCTVGVNGNMAEIEATHTLNVEDPAEEVVIFSNKTELGELISWQVRRIVPGASWCRAFPPNVHSIAVAPGLEVDNYVSTGMDFTENTCGLLVSGKFPDEYQGIWRLEMGLTSGRTLGGFIGMPEGKIPEADDSAITEHNVVVLNVPSGNPFTITCQTQYSAGYCWIQGPRGQTLTSMDELTIGRCSYTNSSALAIDHSGNWTCNMAHVNGGQEEHLVTTVTVIDKLYRAVNPETTVKRGQRTVIACRSVLEHPLLYCRFIRPDGRGLGVTPGMKSTGRYSYEGPGLDHGYCGLVINSVQTVDFGEWTCVSKTRFRTWDEENWDTTVLLARETMSASTIGLTVGVLLLVLIVAGAFVVRYRRIKRTRQLQESIILEYSTS